MSRSHKRGANTKAAKSSVPNASTTSTSADSSVASTRAPTIAPDRERLLVSGHVPALDGIRGIAILLVVIYHSNLLDTQTTTGDKVWYAFIGGGWSGVDLFFVLSGFLITGILVDAMDRTPSDRGHVWRNFFARRVLRIFPLYYAFLAAHLWLLPALGRAINDPVLVEPVQGAAWFWLYVPNLLFAKVGAFVGPRPLMAMWSLGIEEQFYLVWPLVALFVPRRHLKWVCAVGIATAFGFRVWVAVVHAPWIQAFVWPHCRMDTLLIGALVALWLRSPSSPTLDGLRKWVPLLFFATSALIVGTILVEGALRQYVAPVYTVGFTVLALWAASLLLLGLTAPEGSVVRRLFEVAPLRFCGRYAYGLYLTHTVTQHLVLQNVMHVNELYSAVGGVRVYVQLIFTVVSTPIALLVAVVVYHAFEKHFLALKRFVPMARHDDASGENVSPPPGAL